MQVEPGLGSAARRELPAGTPGTGTAYKGA